MTKTVKIPGPNHPITVAPPDRASPAKPAGAGSPPTGQRVTVKAGERVIASTENALTLQESTYPAVHYVPLADVDPAVLERTSHASYCPFKGDASYYSVVLDDSVLENAVWTYESPCGSVAEIAGHVAFYRDKVDISVG